MILLQRNHFCNYLEKKELTLLAKSFKKMTTKYLAMDWQTTKNDKDCGIFLMRHMETYKGSTKNWTTQLKTEKVFYSLDMIFVNCFE